MITAALIPGFPHLLSEDGAPSWKTLGNAARRVGEDIAAARPDALLMISTQWFTVLGHQFQTDPNPRGHHVDENWYDFDFGTFDYDLRIDVDLATAWAKEAEAQGFQARRTNYPHFPIDAGTLTAQQLLDPAREFPIALMSVNLYAAAEDMQRLGEAGSRAADRLGRRVVVVAASGLSSGWINRWIEPAEERFEHPEHDDWNHRILDLLRSGRIDDALAVRDEYAEAARADNQFRALPFLVGAASLRGPGTVLAYGSVWGAGAAVVTWNN